MEKIRKLLSFFCAITLLLPLLGSFVSANPSFKKISANHDRKKASVGRGHKRIIVKLSQPNRSPSPPAWAPSFSPTSDISVRVWKRTATEKIEALKKYILYHFDLRILDGGTYDDTARADGFECHHLISSSYCSKHPDKISRDKAPAVLIPKELHDLTGSNPRSGRSAQYLAIEEHLCETYGIEAGIIFGLVDLIDTLKYYYREVRIISSLDVATLPQVKAAILTAPCDINPAVLKSPAKPKKRRSIATSSLSPKNSGDDTDTLICATPPVSSSSSISSDSEGELQTPTLSPANSENAPENSDSDSLIGPPLTKRRHSAITPYEKKIEDSKYDKNQKDKLRRDPKYALTLQARWLQERLPDRSRKRPICSKNKLS